MPVRLWVRDERLAANRAFHNVTSKRSILFIVSFAFAIGEFDLLNDNVHGSDFDAVLVLVLGRLQATFDENL